LWWASKSAHASLEGNPGNMSSSTGSPESKLARLAWRTARYCNDTGCVQVATAAPGVVAVRDSQNPNGSVLMYSSRQWSWFLRYAKEGGYDWV
jgi:hypothetical protein